LFGGQPSWSFVVGVPVTSAVFIPRIQDSYTPNQRKINKPKNRKKNNRYCIYINKYFKTKL
jgi:hypothetical protein